MHINKNWLVSLLRAGSMALIRTQLLTELAMDVEILGTVGNTAQTPIHNLLLPGSIAACALWSFW